MSITTNHPSFPRINGVDEATATLMVCAVARELRNGQVVAFGLNADSMLSAAMLAQQLHAPDLQIRHGLRAERGMVFGAAAWTDQRKDDSWRQVEYLETHDEILRTANPNSPMRFCDVFFVGGMQIDLEGSTNLIGLKGGDGQLSVRGPGSIGTTSIGTLASNVILFSPEHSPRRFVETVDFVSVPGWKRRSSVGLEGGPNLCVTSKAVMDFKNERMRLRSVHPGLTVEEIVESTGFPLLLPDKVQTTPPPSNAEQHALSYLANRASNSPAIRP